MSLGNRHLFGDIEGIQVTIRSTVIVKPGDLVFQNAAAGLVQKGLANAKATADNYGYPLAAGATETSSLVTLGSHFLGVAMDDSPYGTTDTITVATTGNFRFPLEVKCGVTLGALIGGVSPLSGFDADAQTTASWQAFPYTGLGGNSAVTIGYCIKKESGASYVDVFLRTKTGPGGTA